MFGYMGRGRGSHVYRGNVSFSDLICRTEGMPIAMQTATVDVGEPMPDHKPFYQAGRLGYYKCYHHAVGSTTLRPAKTNQREVFKDEEYASEIERRTVRYRSDTSPTMTHLPAMLIYCEDDPRAGCIQYPLKSWFDKATNKSVALRSTL